MAAKSILRSGNTTFLPGLQNGTAALQVETLEINSVLLEAGGSGIIQVSGAIQPTDIVDNSGSIGTPGQVLAKASTGTDMLWSALPPSPANTISTEGYPGIQTTLTINDTGSISTTIATIPYGDDGTDTYLVGTYLFTMSLLSFEPSADTITGSIINFTCDVNTGSQPILANTGSVNGSGVGYSLSSTQLITFTAAQYGNIEIGLTFTGAENDTVIIPAQGFSLNYVQLA